ncbi:MAG: DUF1269 domain-containing protein [Caldilineaceae bacterium]|nr:DUF1269 domain-containing protein [Caldilineaceae bacterium]
MSENLNDQVIVGFFTDQDAADKAADALMNWDDANDDIKLGTIGCVTLNEKGKVHTKRYGEGRTVRGALLGGALGLVAAGLTSGLSLLAGTLGGGALGGVTGKLTTGSLGLTDDDVAKIKSHLEKGGAAVVVLCDSSESEQTIAQLESIGGTAQGFGVSNDVLATIHENQAEKLHDQQVDETMEDSEFI